MSRSSRRGERRVTSIPPRIHHYLGHRGGARCWVQQLLYPGWKLHICWPNMDLITVGPLVWPPVTNRDEVLEREHAMSILSKHVTRAGGPPVDMVPITGCLEGAPGVLEFMTADTYPDGQIRKRSTLMIFAEDGQLKGCLNDRDAERTLWRSGPSVEDIVLSLEIALVEPGTDWRKASSGNRPVQKKK